MFCCDRWKINGLALLDRLDAHKENEGLYCEHRLYGSIPFSNPKFNRQTQKLLYEYHCYWQLIVWLDHRRIGDLRKIQHVCTSILGRECSSTLPGKSEQPKPDFLSDVYKNQISYWMCTKTWFLIRCVLYTRARWIWSKGIKIKTGHVLSLFFWSFLSLFSQKNHIAICLQKSMTEVCAKKMNYMTMYDQI